MLPAHPNQLGTSVYNFLVEPATRCPSLMEPIGKSALAASLGPCSSSVLAWQPTPAACAGAGPFAWPSWNSRAGAGRMTDIQMAGWNSGRPEPARSGGPSVNQYKVQVPHIDYPGDSTCCH